MYKPLPNSLTIKQSEIEGLGLFAVEDIKENTNLGLSHVTAINGSLTRTPLGGFYNHSENSNCIKRKKGSSYALVTDRDIKKGEEITVNYTFYKL